MVDNLSIAREPAAMAAPRTPAFAASVAAPAQPSAVAWGAIFAGAVAMAATSLILLSLGAGLGLSAASPWAGEGASMKAIAVIAVIWMVVVQWLSAALGGYLTGRLRVRWAFHEDEVYFRDTAHGFLAWALSIVAIAVIASGVFASVVGGTAHGIAAGASQAASQSDAGPVAGLVDTLYRSDNPAPNASSDDAKGETARLLARGLGDAGMSPTDRAYLARLVSARTGLAPDEAQQRVDEVIVQAKQAADTARKAAAKMAIATAMSLAIGAFIAAVAAGFGGRQRDF